MIDWVRRLIGRRPNRATVTLMPDGQIILGLPGDVSDEMRHHIVAQLKVWRANPTGSLVFPFPVDVFDRR